MKAVATTVIWLLTFGSSLFAQSNGVLQLHQKNPHYFLYQNKPTVLIRSGEPYRSVVNLDFDYKKYLQSTAKAGMITTRYGPSVGYPGWGFTEN